MIPINLNLIPCLVLSIFVVFSWTLFSPCHADDYRFLPEGSPAGGGSTTNSTLPLAAERTRRIDPNDFNYYEGGWDITNNHYILSVAFSGAPLFVTATLWCSIVPIGFIIIICLYCCGCCDLNKSRTDYARKTYTISLIFLSLFLIMTIVGGVFLFSGQAKFQNTAADVSAALVSRAYAVIDIVGDVLNNLKAAKSIQVGKFSLPDDIKESIGKVESMSNQTETIKIQAEQTAKTSKEFLNAVSQNLITVGILMLILAVVGFIISMFGFKWIVYILIFIGWILVTITFILSGVSLVVHNGMADTCVAMNEWVQHPREHTSLSKLLPCMDEAAARKTFDLTRNTSYQMVTLANAFVVHVANNQVPPSVEDLYYNQSGPPMPLLCNPFFPNLTERTCGPSEVALKGAPVAYESFLCNTSPSDICITMGRLTPALYSHFMVAANMSDTLHLHGPLLTRLVDCSFVVETFSQIDKEHCPSLKRYSNQVFIGLVLISVAAMFSVILWLVFVRERQIQISSEKQKKPL